MYLIALCGLLMSGLSIIMIANPNSWSKGIVIYSTKAYFHLLEILSRLGIGVIYVVFADTTGNPPLMLVVGYVHIFASVILTFMPPLRHMQFAVWSARTYKKIFRHMGVLTFCFGLFIIYTALQGPIEL